MRRRPIIIGVGTLALAVAFVVTSIVIGKSANTISASQNEKKVDKPDILGTIDGKKNPELIPDHIAYTLIFRTLALRQNTDLEKKRSRAWAKSSGLDDTDTDRLLAAATEFEKRVSVLDNQVKAIKDRSWPNPTTQVMEQLADLQKKKEVIVAEAVASLSVQLGNNGKEKLHNHMRHIKRNMKMAPGRTVPHGKDH